MGAGRAAAACGEPSKRDELHACVGERYPRGGRAGAAAAGGGCGESDLGCLCMEQQSSPQRPKRRSCQGHLDEIIPTQLYAKKVCG